MAAPHPDGSGGGGGPTAPALIEAGDTLFASAEIRIVRF
jgi:hypothetical protein